MCRTNIRKYNCTNCVRQDHIKFRILYIIEKLFIKNMSRSTEILISVDHFTVLLKGKKSQWVNSLSVKSLVSRVCSIT
jgi:hypothetical protein